MTTPAPAAPPAWSAAPATGGPLPLRAAAGGKGGEAGAGGAVPASQKADESEVACPPSPPALWSRLGGRPGPGHGGLEVDLRPGSVFRKGYKDTQRDRAPGGHEQRAHHLHPVKVKRHGLKLAHTFCLGGLSFFLFIL